MALSCSDVQVGLAAAIRASYVVMDDGSFARRIIEVEEGEDLTCDDVVSTQTMEWGSLEQVEPGKWALKALIVT